MMAWGMAFSWADGAEPGARDRVAILNDAMPGQDAQIAEAVAATLRGAGLQTDFLSADGVCDQATLGAEKYFLYVLPNARCYPVLGVEVLDRYLRDQGNLLILGVPPSDNPAWKYQGRWIDRNEVLATLARQKPARMLFDFDTMRKPSAWHRGLGAPSGGSVEVVAGGADGSPACMQITFQHNDFKSFDTWSAAFEPDSTLGSRPLVCFWAKGDDRTPQLAVRLSHGESKTDAGVAVVPLETTWRHYVLRQEDFSHLGHADTAKAVRISLSACYDMESRNILTQDAHRVWIDQIAMAVNPLAELGDTERPGLPPIETVSPGYKRYPLQNADSLRLLPSASNLGHGDWKGLTTAVGGPGLFSSCYARPEGKGFQRGYQWRWIPVVQAHDAQGEQRGTVAWMLLHRKPLDEGPAFRDAVRRALGARQDQPPTVSREGSVCAVCATADTAILQDFLRSGLVTEMVDRIRQGLFLSHAGSEYFAYWPGERVRLGAVAVNHGLRQATVRVRVRVSAENGAPSVFEKEADVTIEAGQSATAAWDWTPGEWPGDHYVVTTELLRDGRRIDCITHEVGVLSQKKPARDAFVTVKDGDFWVEGKKFYPVGVNYWPRYAMGLAGEDYVYHWLTPGYYNPEEIERDLRLLESLGTNFVIIRANAENDVRTLPDFLRRCRNHGMRAMAMVQSHVITDDPHYFQAVMLPFHFQEAVVAEFLRATRLVDNPTLLGYDIIWEPSGWVFGTAQTTFGGDSTPYRQRWDDDWSKWIVDRYGSLAAAEADWGVQAPRLGDRVTSPSNQQMSNDGPWRVMVAAYRRFMDDRMSRSFNDATRKLRRLDPRHLISFRQGSISPQDFGVTATGKHVDYVSMEGYRFRPSEDQVGVHAVRFMTRYNQCMTKGKPVVWVEFGPTVWDRTSMQPRDRLMGIQQQCHELIYRAALECGANGAAPWWWAGGYRTTEGSDHGIVNPDGTRRPAALMLQEYASLFPTRRDVRPLDAWFTVDRDRHPGSHWYVTFNDGAEAFRQAATAGRRLGVRTAGEGTTSADTPLLAVGNTKCNGRNPPKYLDAEFNGFKIKVADGPWVEVADGTTIRVAANRPIVATASVGNLQAATWLTPASCPSRPGAVYLASTDASQLPVKVPVPRDTPRLEDADFGPSFPLTPGISSPVKIELRMTAEGRAWFGERLRFTLEPEGDGTRKP
jgi:hypothetical protein